MRLKQRWQFVLYLIGSLFIRFWNFHNSLYFIYDQGRDAWVFDRIAHGDLVLVGPTSGLSGFFLGPLWYYIGLPGSILSGGSPYGISLWYIAVSCLALPLYWYLAHRIFKSSGWAILLAVLLSVLTGSLTASTMIWNPLLAAPLMLGALLSLWQARLKNSRIWLGIGFFCLALTLQSEFAYAVFYIIPLFLAIPWIKQKFDWRDYAVVIAMVGVTLLPQMAFEVRNQFIMTQSLLGSTASSDKNVSWALQFKQRPTQLLEATQQVIFGANDRTPYLLPLLIGLAALGGYAVLKDKSLKHPFLWKLIFVFAILPYPFYMLWRGNNGFFFWYYLTCHYVFLVPLIVLGAAKFIQLAPKNTWKFTAATAFVLFVMLSLFATSWQNWYDTFYKAEGNANLAKMVQTVKTANAWHQEDGSQPFVVRTFTANILTEQYDYLFYWHAKKHNLPVPSTVRNENDQTWYILIETSDRIEKSLFEDWYTKATEGGKLVKQEKIGDLQLEKWQK